MSNLSRCPWCERHDLLREYHDNEWGVPNSSQIHLYEHFILETFQAGLNWLTMLKKRENFRRAFAGCDPEKIVLFTEVEAEKMMSNEGLIRNRGKIEAGINNAGIFLKISEEYDGFWNYLLKFKPDEDNRFESESEIPARTKESADLAHDLKAQGFKFIGPVSAYAYMQGVGIVNDHIVACYRYAEVEKLRKE